VNEQTDDQHRGQRRGPVFTVSWAESIFEGERLSENGSRAALCEFLASPTAFANPVRLIVEDIPMSTMTDKMSKSSSKPRAAKEQDKTLPQAGDRFHCPTCGMEIEVTTTCKCDDPDHVHLVCCNQELQKR
jgi:hypothetical protein